MCSFDNLQGVRACFCIRLDLRHFGEQEEREREITLYDGGWDFGPGNGFRKPKTPHIFEFKSQEPPQEKSSTAAVSVYPVFRYFGILGISHFIFHWRSL